MISRTPASLDIASLLQELEDRLDLLLAHLVTAEPATRAGWIESGYVLLTLIFLGIPLLSLLLAGLTHLLSPLLDGRGLRAALGLTGLGAGEQGNLETQIQAAREGLPRSLVALLLVGLVPVLGTVAGVLYYRLSPLPTMGRAVRPATLGPVRWMLPPTAMLLVFLQPLPILGPLCMPLLYATFHAVYDTALRQLESAQVEPREATA